MAAILALLPSVIALLPYVTQGVTALLNLIASIRTAAKQTGEWTPELEAQWVAMLFQLALGHEAKPDAQL